MSKYTRNTEKNYVSAIRGAIGTNMFRHLFLVDEHGVEFDAADDGENSCALFVTAILHLFARIDRMHATVNSVVEYFEKSKFWQKTENPQQGDIVIYPSIKGGGTGHIGFLMADDEVISNSSEKKTPNAHSLIMNDGRKPIAYWHWQS